jgi:hypothetical protein
MALPEDEDIQPTLDINAQYCVMQDENGSTPVLEEYEPVSARDLRKRGLFRPNFIITADIDDG